ncbi:MAG TPA: hypothetical protein VIH57_23490 [Bacteroidales bacterium]
MRHIVYISILLLSINCSLIKSSNDSKNGLDNKPKIDLDSLLNVKQNDHSAILKNGELSLCCYDIVKVEILDLAMFKKQSEKHAQDNRMQNVNVYTFEDSYFKEFYNSEINRLDLVYGRINSDKIQLSNGLKIGMTKSGLLGLIFKQSKLFDSINDLKVYENEMGDYWTNYIFKNEKLVEIQFDSSYDWIDKKLKK